jgi:hypothetical protein
MNINKKIEIYFINLFILYKLNINIKFQRYSLFTKKNQNKICTLLLFNNSHSPLFKKNFFSFLMFPILLTLNVHYVDIDEIN